MLIRNYKGYKDLLVFQKSCKLSIEIYRLTLTFPQEEKYSLTNQIRRSSRSIAANIAESWPKRIYPKMFVNKLTDSLSEHAETEVWLLTAKDLNYISIDTFNKLTDDYKEVACMLTSMINKPQKFSK